MNRHVLKTDPEPFDAVASGKKTHEIRRNDRDFKVGDVLVLRKTLHTGAQMRLRSLPLEYVGEPIERTVTHIQRGYGLTDGWWVLSLATPSVPASLAELMEEWHDLRDEYANTLAELHSCPSGEREAARAEVHRANAALESFIERIAGMGAKGEAPKQQHADWGNRHMNDLDGCINELLTLADHPKMESLWARTAIKVIASNFKRITAQPTPATGASKLTDERIADEWRNWTVSDYGQSYSIAYGQFSLAVRALEAELTQPASEGFAP